ncbi:hypothetical protein B0O99DRAFT_629251 [Bisporella sp. PMI_857]|nr:hypothetical protein B0O99DRAFT_629251 [Bisporella sp. PMI_857]
MSVSTLGFAVRVNGSCQSNEVDCGQTVFPYHACCPSGSFCPQQYNVNCCPTSANCTATLIQDPQCANQTWDLYDNNGYFCCHKGRTGYASTTNSDGCALPGYAFRSGEVLLNVITTEQAVTSSASSTSSVSTQTFSTLLDTSTTASTARVAANPSKTNTGAIVGGVIGGIVVGIAIALAIWILRRKKRSRSSAKGTGIPVLGQNKPQELHGAEVAQLDDQHRYGEMSTSQEAKQLASPHGVSELPG